MDNVTTLKTKHKKPAVMDVTYRTRLLSPHLSFIIEDVLSRLRQDLRTLIRLAFYRICWCPRGSWILHLSPKTVIAELSIAVWHFLHVSEFNHLWFDQFLYHGSILISNAVTQKYLEGNSFIFSTIFFFCCTESLIRSTCFLVRFFPSLLHCHLK